MPYYVYKCPTPDCLYNENTVELSHSIKDCDIPIHCPLCESKQVKAPMVRQVTMFGFQDKANPAKREVIKLKL